jgi:hypothetical protein
MNNYYWNSVFINAPFDINYRNKFEALAFSVCDCGFIPRCTKETQNSAQTRIPKLYNLIGSCRYGIHDLSLMGLDKHNRLPRFNMPLELGISLGAQQFGKQKNAHILLVLDSQAYRYQKSCSDLAGIDIEPHNNKEEKMIEIVRNWLALSPDAKSRHIEMPSGKQMVLRYNLFRKQLPIMCSTKGFNSTNLPYNDFLTFCIGWLKVNTIT